MSSLKISIVRTTLHKGSGQVVHIRELTRRLKAMGHEVSIFCRDIHGEIDLLNPLRVKFPFDGVPFLRHVGFAVKAGLMMKDFDIVHTQYHPGVFAGNAYHFLEGKPHVFTFHGFAPARIWRDAAQKLKMIDHQLGTFFALRSRVDRIIAVSRFLKRELLRFYRFNPAKINVIYNGIDTDRFNPKVDGGMPREEYGFEHNPVVLFLGRLAPYKGPQFLVMAAPHVLEEVPETRFIVAGSGRYDVPRLRLLTKKLDVERAFIFTGYIADDKVPNMYASCDVFCYPSLWEGFGLTPAEAQACGKPVVAFNHCALPEVVKNHETGILVPPGDHVGLARALIELLSNEKRRDEMGVRGRRHVVGTFSWDRMAEKTVEVYERAIASRGMKRR